MFICQKQKLTMAGLPVEAEVHQAGHQKRNTKR